jgi:hypothetical protein
MCVLGSAHQSFHTVAMNQLMGSGMPAKVYESLSIGDGKQCWNVYADVVVLDYDGALLDCCSMGMYYFKVYLPLFGASFPCIHHAAFLAMNAHIFWTSHVHLSHIYVCI